MQSSAHDATCGSAHIFIVSFDACRYNQCLSNSATCCRHFRCGHPGLHGASHPDLNALTFVDTTLAAHHGGPQLVLAYAQSLRLCHSLQPSVSYQAHFKAQCRVENGPPLRPPRASGFFCQIRRRLRVLQQGGLHPALRHSPYDSPVQRLHSNAARARYRSMLERDNHSTTKTVGVCNWQRARCPSELCAVLCGTKS